MKKSIVLMLAMAVMVSFVACDDGSSDSSGMIKMAIHNQMETALVKVKGATVGSDNLVDMWTGTAPCAAQGLIPLNPDDAFILYNDETGDYTTVDLPAGRFTAWYSVVDDDGATSCDFGNDSLDDVITPGFTGKEVQPTYDLVAGNTYFVVFDEAYASTDYHAIWQKVGNDWTGNLLTQVSE